MIERKEIVSNVLKKYEYISDKQLLIDTISSNYKKLENSYSKETKLNFDIYMIFELCAVIDKKLVSLARNNNQINDELYKSKQTTLMVLYGFMRKVYPIVSKEEIEIIVTDCWDKIINNFEDGSFNQYIVHYIKEELVNYSNKYYKKK